MIFLSNECFRLFEFSFCFECSSCWSSTFYGLYSFLLILKFVIRLARRKSEERELMWYIYSAIQIWSYLPRIYIKNQTCPLEWSIKCNTWLHLQALISLCCSYWIQVCKMGQLSSAHFAKSRWHVPAFKISTLSTFLEDLRKCFHSDSAIHIFNRFTEILTHFYSRKLDNQVSCKSM